MPVRKKNEVEQEKPLVPMSTVIITRESLYPHLPCEQQDREEYFITTYLDSHHSGSYYLPPNRSQFEYLWANCISKDREVVLKVDRQEPYNTLCEFDIKRDFCKYPNDPDLAEKMSYIIIMMAYNVMCQIHNQILRDAGIQETYKKVDFIIVHGNHHRIDRENLQGNYVGSAWRYRDNWVLFLGCYKWIDLLECIKNNCWIKFWNMMCDIFCNKHIILSRSDTELVIGRYVNMPVPEMRKKYIKDEYCERTHQEGIAISKTQLIQIIENSKFPVRVLESIQRIIETCR